MQEQNNGSGARVTGSEGPLRIRVSGIQSKQDTSLESSERTGDGVNEEENKAVRQDISPESDPVNRKAFVATTAAPLSRDSTTGNRYDGNEIIIQGRGNRRVVLLGGTGKRTEAERGRTRMS